MALDAALRAERWSELPAVVGGFGLAVLVAGILAGFAGLLPVGLVLIGTAYTVSLLLVGPGLDGGAPLVAAGLVVAAELAYWSLELRTPVRAEPGILSRRAALVAGIGAGAVVVGTLVFAAATVPLGGGVFWDAVGVVAATAALVIVARLAARQSDM